MDNTVNKNDLQALPGTAIGTKSLSKIQENTIIYPENKDLKSVGQKVFSAIENSVSNITDEHRSAKYAVDPDAAYYGSGAISLLPRLGKFIFTASLNDANRGAFRLSQADSTFYSTANQTTLGSTDIGTLDAWFSLS